MEVAIAGSANRKFIDVRKYNRKIAWLSSANCEGLKEKEISILLGFNVRISCPNFDREFRPPRTLGPAGCHTLSPAGLLIIFLGLVKQD